MDLFVEIVFVICTLILISVVLLQAGRGDGLGTALGGGASQGVFGGGGGADFLAKLTQGLAAAFMICSVYLAYASTHTGSERLRRMSEELESEKHLVDEEGEINYEAVGPNPLPLPAGDALPTPSKPVEAAPAEGAEGEAIDLEAIEGDALPGSEPVDAPEGAALDGEPGLDEPALDGEPAPDEPAPEGEPVPADEPALDEPAPEGAKAPKGAKPPKPAPQP